ncbi:MAG: hypothetical protein EOO28_30655 [Comamonadaceae bacterium]|nr:MAG: hypothetical protein EOO28_30655 [Comamonadaceae bacterium]
MMKNPWPGMSGRAMICAALAAALLAGCLGDSDDAAAPAAPGAPGPLLAISTINNRADLVSGGDAMVDIALPAGVSAATLKVDVDGRDVSSAFAVRADGRVTGLVTGLIEGANVLSATATGASAAKLTITNASRGGPVISGAQTVPFVCATPLPRSATASSPATNGSGLSTEATDAKCNIATEYKLYYKTNTPGCTTGLPDPSAASTAYGSTTLVVTTATAAVTACFKPYDPAAPAPADMSTTVTDAGKTVSFIVRVERGTMNRGIYDIVALFDPTKPWTAVAPQAQWNGKLIYTFGASTGQVRRQQRTNNQWTSTSQAAGNIDPQTAIAKGYVWVSNSMTDSAVNSNRILMSETVMMMREHIADNYGPVKYAHGTGCSGGSINSNTNATIAPGLLDGYSISCAFPDSETTAIEVSDCVALVEAYQKPQWTTLMGTATAATINAKKAAINGHVDQTGCHGWFNAFGSNSKAGNYNQRFVADNASGLILANPVARNNCELLPSQVYDPVSNPTGARCGGSDWAASVWGKDADGKALQTGDNTGVQYGLKALLSNAISGEEFVTLNEIAGGSDKDANPKTTRTVADPGALPIAYRSGMVMNGKNYAKAAVIDMRGWDDAYTTGPVPSSNVHFVWRSFAIRDRLDKEFGDHANHALWRFGRFGLGAPPFMAAESLSVMDTWLTALKADTTTASLEQKVRSAKPASAADYCVLSTDTAQATKVSDITTCNADPKLSYLSSPRQVAGGPLAENVFKCQLRPVNDVEYGGRLDAGQLLRLRAVFTGGVCDWSKPGVGQQDPVSPLTFKAGPGGAAFAAAPGSIAK